METGRNRLPIKQNLLAMLALGAAVASLAAVKLVPVAEGSARDLYRAAQLEFGQPDSPLSRDDPHYTDRQFAGMRYRTLKARPNDGFDDLSARANQQSGIFSDGVVVEERRYLRHELEDQAGRQVLWAGDSLRVPIVPDASKNQDGA